MTRRKKPDPNEKLYDQKDLHSWLEEAIPGQEYVYWTGFLAKDRDDASKPERSKQADLMGKAAMSLCEAGKVTLVQRRTPKKARFEYIAVKLLPKNNRWVREANALR